jgi:predicted anti-sigma-YlaC factor YlaD
MSRCQRPDLSEQLLMALSPAEFSERMPEIVEHLGQCSSCREEIEELTQLDETLRNQKDQLADLFSPCPDPDALFEFVHGEAVKPDIEKHLALCSDCAEQVSLMKELSQENIELGTASVPLGAKELVRRIGTEQYAPVGQPLVRWADNLLLNLRAFFHLPSLAAGAVIGALLIMFLAPHGQRATVLKPALSSVEWKAPASTLGKEMAGPGDTFVERQKIALIILAPPDAKLSESDIDEIYIGVDIATRLGGQYRFLSPRDVAEVLRNERDFRDNAAVAKLAAGKTGANYVLTFEVLPAGNRYSLKGTLFQADRKSEIGSIFQSGLQLSGIPARITNVGMELILEAESS